MKVQIGMRSSSISDPPHSVKVQTSMHISSVSDPPDKALLQSVELFITACGIPEPFFQRWYNTGSRRLSVCPRHGQRSGRWKPDHGHRSRW